MGRAAAEMDHWGPGGPTVGTCDIALQSALGKSPARDQLGLIPEHALPPLPACIPDPCITFTCLPSQHPPLPGPHLQLERPCLVGAAQLPDVNLHGLPHRVAVLVAHLRNVGLGGVLSQALISRYSGNKPLFFSRTCAHASWEERGVLGWGRRLEQGARKCGVESRTRDGASGWLGWKVGGRASGSCAASLPAVVSPGAATLASVRATGTQSSWLPCRSLEMRRAGVAGPTLPIRPVAAKAKRIWAGRGGRGSSSRGRRAAGRGGHALPGKEARHKPTRTPASQARPLAPCPTQASLLHQLNLLHQLVPVDCTPAPITHHPVVAAAHRLSLEHHHAAWRQRPALHSGVGSACSSAVATAAARGAAGGGAVATTAATTAATGWLVAHSGCGSGGSHPRPEHPPAGGLPAAAPACPQAPSSGRSAQTPPRQCSPAACVVGSNRLRGRLMEQNIADAVRQRARALLAAKPQVAASLSVGAPRRAPPSGTEHRCQSKPRFTPTGNAVQDKGRGFL